MNPTTHIKEINNSVINCSLVSTAKGGERYAKDMLNSSDLFYCIFYHNNQA